MITAKAIDEAALAAEFVAEIERERIAYEAEETFEGFLLSDLRRAFEAVQNPNDWKAPIKASIGKGSLAVTTTAVGFFTGTTLRVVGFDANGLRVEADGYRAGPCGDH